MVYQLKKGNHVRLYTTKTELVNSLERATKLTKNAIKNRLAGDNSVVNGFEITKLNNKRSIKTIKSKPETKGILYGKWGNVYYTNKELKETEFSRLQIQQILYEVQKRIQSADIKRNQMASVVFEYGDGMYGTDYTTKGQLLNLVNIFLNKFFQQYRNKLEIDSISIKKYTISDKMLMNHKSSNTLTDLESLLLEFLNKYKEEDIKGFLNKFEFENIEINTINNCVFNSCLISDISRKGNKITDNMIKYYLKQLKQKENVTISLLTKTKEKVELMSKFLKCKINVYDEIKLLETIGNYENEINIMLYLNHCYPLLIRKNKFDYNDFRTKVINQQEKIIINPNLYKSNVCVGTVDILFNEDGTIKTIYNTLEGKRYDYYTHESIEDDQNYLIQKFFRHLNDHIEKSGGKYTDIIIYTHRNEIFNTFYKLCTRSTYQRYNKVDAIIQNTENDYILLSVGKVRIHNINQFKFDQYKLVDNSELKESTTEDNIVHNIQTIRKIIEHNNKFLLDNYDVPLNTIGMVTPSTLAKHLFQKNNKDADIYTISKYLESEIRSKCNLGGYNKVFGKAERENVKVYDFSSSYPYSMVKEMFPTGQFKLIKEDKMEYNKEWFGLIHLKVNIDKSNNPLELIELPEVWITTVEFEYLINECGNKYEYEIIEVLHYENKTNEMFKYVQDLYDIKQKTKEPISKLIANSSYGFFSKRYTQNNINIFKKTDAMYDSVVLSNRVKEYNDIGENQYMIKYESVTIPKVANIILSMFINSYSRIRLHRLIREVIAEDGEVYYCDTDSIYTNLDLTKNKKFKKYEIDSGKIGSLKFEGLAEDCIFLDTKKYAYKMNNIEEIKMAGYSKDTKYDNKIVDNENREVRYVKKSKEGKYNMTYDDFRMMLNKYSVYVDTEYKMRPSLFNETQNRDISYMMQVN